MGETIPTRKERRGAKMRLFPEEVLAENYIRPTLPFLRTFGKKLRTFGKKLRTFGKKLRTFGKLAPTESPINKGLRPLPKNPLIFIIYIILINRENTALTPFSGLSLFSFKGGRAAGIRGYTMGKDGYRHSGR